MYNFNYRLGKKLKGGGHGAPKIILRQGAVQANVGGRMLHLFTQRADRSFELVLPGVDLEQLRREFPAPQEMFGRSQEGGEGTEEQME